MKLTHLTLATAILCLTTSISAFAQKDSTKQDIWGGYICIPLEFPIIDNSALNTELSKLDLPACKYPVATIGAGFLFQLNHSIISFTYSESSRKPKSDTASLTTKYTTASFNYGYDLLKNTRTSFFPYLGVKTLQLNYLFNEKVPNNSNLTFQQYMTTPLQHKEIRNLNIGLDMGLAYSVQSFFYLALRAGYILPLGKGIWYINNDQVALANGPSVKYKAYITLTIGAGTISGEKERRKKAKDDALRSM